MRVLHWPSNTGNHPAGLVEAERRRGLDSDLVCIETGPFYHEVPGRSLELGNAPLPARWWKRLVFARSAIDEYDVFHFNKGESFLPGSLPLAVDLWWLKRRGKTVVVTFQGSDARPQVPGAPRTSMLPPRITDLIKRLRIRQITRWADHTFCLNPDLVAHVPGSAYLPYASVDPASLRPEPTVRAQGGQGGLRVVHAPSNRAIKGTDQIIDAVNDAAQHIEIELDVVEGAPHDEVLERIRRADVAVDQLILGWYGGFAVECMALGKPTIAHIDPSHRPQDLPLVEADVETLATVLVDLATDDLHALGTRCRAWVEANHDPDEIVETVVAAYAG